jgi:hypothetical protein
MKKGESGKERYRRFLQIKIIALNNPWRKPPSQIYNPLLKAHS